jgi:hypothetical protein
MANQFTAIFEREGAWVVAYCPEIPNTLARKLPWTWGPRHRLIRSTQD